MQAGEKASRPLAVDEPERDAPERRLSDLQFAKRVAIALGIFAIGYFLWVTSDVVMLIFAAILVAVLLRTVASALKSYAYIGEMFALPLAVILTAGAVAGFVYLFGAHLGGQMAQMVDRLPEAIDGAGQRFGVDNATQRLEDAIRSETGSSFLSSITRWSYSLVGIVANIVLVVVAAVYFAINPCVYRRGFAMLFPPDQHTRVFEALDATNRVLRLWLAGQFVTMVLVGVVSALAYWWIGLPSPIALGLIAGVTNFVPFLGPILSAIPALVFALSIDTQTVIWTLAAVVVIQQFESDVVTPLIQRRAVSLPPAVGVFAIVVFGIAFGMPGVVFGVPLAVALISLIRNLWVREMLQAEPTPPPNSGA
ncbi:MAG: AI-2E family transporter [Beijerinckiaceae bacterium]|nr:AI-2E family transporter [Beijerinckiaceae bacterium]